MAVSGDAPIIRDGRPDDLDALMALFYAAVRQVAVQDYTPRQVAAWAPDHMERHIWADAWSQRWRWVGVAEIAGTAAGFCAMAAAGHVDMMFTHPAFLRRGVASSLLTAATAFARRDGAGGLTTDASITARPFFVRRGFTVAATQTVARNGESFVNYRMTKALASP